jgi:Tfp pilus assembly ATPase PilU
MTIAKLTDADFDLYRRYAVGLITYDEAMRAAESEFHLRRALLQFDQNTQPRNSPGDSLSVGRA